MMRTQFAQNRKLRYTRYEKYVYCHKCYDGLSVIISKSHRDFGLTFSSVYMFFNANTTFDQKTAKVRRICRFGYVK